MAKARKKAGPHIFARSGRWYADFRSYADVGGDRSALSEPGSSPGSWGTTDRAVAEALFAAKLTEFQGKRRGRAGVQQARSTALAVLVRDHLITKAKAGRTSRSHLNGLEHRLGAALDHFGTHRDPRSIEPSDVGPGRTPWPRVAIGSQARCATT